MSSGDDQQMDTDADKPELQRNCKEASVLSEIPNFAISHPAGDSLTNEKDLSPITPEMMQALYSEDIAIQMQGAQKFRKLLWDSRSPPIEQLIKSGTVPRFVHFLNDTRYPELQLDSAWVLTNIASGNSAQTQVVIDAGALPVLSRLLSSPDENVVKTSIWALGNIAGGTSAQTQVVIESGAVPHLIRLISSLHTGVVEQTIWALGNIARHSTESRDLLLNSNVLPTLLGLFNDNASLSLMRIAIWTLRRLCHKKPPPNFAQVSQCLPLLSRLIVNQDAEILVNVCRALSYLCKGSNEQIQVVIDSGVCPRAIQLLSHSSNKVVFRAIRLVGYIASGDGSQTQVLINLNALPALGILLSHEMESIVENACWTLSNISYGSIDHIQAVIDSGVCHQAVQLFSHSSTDVVRWALWLVGNIAKGNDSQTQVLINANALPVLGSLLSHKKKRIVMNACRALSKITAGNEQQIQAVIDANIFPSLIVLLYNRDREVRKRAAWAINKATANGSEEQIACLVDAGAIAPLCQLLTERDSNLVDVVLSGLERILQTGESFANTAGSTVNPYATFVKQCDGFEKIALLSSHYKVKIAQMASALIEMYFA